MSSPTTHARNGLLASAVAVLSLAVLVSASGVSASTTHHRLSKGDVTAAFQTRTTGGMVNLLSGRTIAAPVRGLQDGRISPFHDSILCSQDWHYLAVTLVGVGDRNHSLAYLGAASVTFAIDGTAVTPTIRSAVKPFVGTGIPGQLSVSIGTLVAPGTIADGDHSLATQITTPDFGPETLSVTFTVTPDACD